MWFHLAKGGLWIYCVAEANLAIPILLPPFTKQWDYKHVLLHPIGSFACGILALNPYSFSFVCFVFI